MRPSPLEGHGLCNVCEERNGLGANGVVSATA